MVDLVVWFIKLCWVILGGAMFIGVLANISANSTYNKNAQFDFSKGKYGHHYNQAEQDRRFPKPKPFTFKEGK